MGPISPFDDQDDSEVVKESESTPSDETEKSQIDGDVKSRSKYKVEVSTVLTFPSKLPNMTLNSLQKNPRERSLQVNRRRGSRKSPKITRVLEVRDYSVHNLSACLTHAEQ